MAKFLVLFFKILFAAILAIATIITVVILSPAWLIFWIWKQLSEKIPRS
ncbi:MULTISPECIES: hypothetical protein [Dyadobacter]|uniref:Uncharacterized protein n=1 Tax=Dyadobacter chenhuakuii TaxID=2909339 RepID=A0A9X1QHX9_9BACT|nr:MULTISPECIES: hypothetical protein [Dyadobacter]MCE7071221.1 hypothetical protein [Dyadobacter sp. CY327]MCF2493891.1 hypothetical protein [Dyadobacter chenhuakuii]MCF2500598.1 hypothetical protein [Dyadobacter chenhuakuii]MCF2518139.1 hypothetical protein [Dyadobacter sp. CY351]USJ31022.1 hypothetical protein NFI80_24595 [Dyadobacter chenhuakuii]